jgi:TrfA protein
MAKTIVRKTDAVPAEPLARRNARSKPAAAAAMQPVGDILSKFPRIAQKSAEAMQQAQASAAAIERTTQNVRQLMLPFWPDQFRSLPNEIFRSALFNARNRNLKREYLKDQEIYVIGDGRVAYTGEELRQDDETVWLQLIQISKAQPVGQTVKFTARSFCKAIDWPVKGDSYLRLRDCLTRMQASSLQVMSKRLGASGGKAMSMIPVFDWRDKESGRALTHYEVQLAEPLVELFGGKGYFTRVEWAQRLDLPDGLATWLHGYFASHDTPFPIKLETIRAGAGLTTKGLTHLRELVKTALDELKRVEFLKDWTFSGPDMDLVTVERLSTHRIDA